MLRVWLLVLLSACPKEADPNPGAPCDEPDAYTCVPDAEGGLCCVRCVDGTWEADPPINEADPINTNCPLM